ncbi:unnamed protein product [Owenia fusiformis]|uniref:PNPLA domain-containing protein n=1 Tax=Owenia fusiformis TaxID=6347 RepID=A0A8S4NTD5_OWEFU|nr:unnamed protein product [Owenia fusiformis]
MTSRSRTCFRYLSPGNSALQSLTRPPARFISGDRELNTTHKDHNSNEENIAISSKNTLRNFRAANIYDIVKGQFKDVAQLKETVGLGAALRRLAALNIDIPQKYLPNYKKLKVGSVKIKLPDMKILDSDADRQRDEEKQIIEWKRKKKNQLEMKVKEIESKTHRYMEIKRETHDIETAMKETQESVKVFYDSVQEVNNKNKNNNVFNMNNSPPKKAKMETQKLSSSERMIQNFRELISSDKKPQENVEGKNIEKRECASKSALAKQYRELVVGVARAQSNMSRLQRLEKLNEHLVQYPDVRHVTMKEDILNILLPYKHSPDKALREEIRQTLALVGYTDPVKGRGIRVLTIDGGGTRGLIAIEVMKRIQKMCNREMHELFDYICGVSTGSLIAMMVGVYRIPLEECDRVYKMYAYEMFKRSKHQGISSLVQKQAYYDTDQWVNILKHHMGEKLLIDTAKDIDVPKMATVSSLYNTPIIKNHIFRNYNLPSSALSHYVGSCQHKVWQSIRASSAAPGYYEECKLGQYIHRDGGLFSNNPTAIALHEAQLLWPNTDIQCVVSLGTGRWEPQVEKLGESLSLRHLTDKFIQSATDTEAVHTTLQDLLPAQTYFRFNPFMADDFLLDENRPEKLDLIQRDARTYLERNDHKIKRAAQQLLQPKMFHQKVKDYLREKKDTYL